MENIRKYYRYVIRDKTTGIIIESNTQKFTTVEQANWGTYIYLELGDFPNRLSLETSIYCIIEEEVVGFEVEEDEYGEYPTQGYREAKGTNYFKTEVRNKGENFLTPNVRKYETKELAYITTRIENQIVGLINKKDYEIVVFQVTEELKCTFSYVEQVQYWRAKKTPVQAQSYITVIPEAARKATSKSDAAQIAIIVGSIAILVGIFDNHIHWTAYLCVVLICFFIVLDAHKNPI